MARTKSDRKVGSHSSEQMKAALEMIKSGKSIRQAAICKKLAFATVYRYYKKTQNNPEQTDMRLVPNYEINRVFTEAQEQTLITYLKDSAYLFYGLSNIDCRRLAYETAVINKLRVPESWTLNEMAGVDWLKGFRARHPEVSLRVPESCSLARATGFNKHNVDKYFENLEIVMKRQRNFSDGTRVYNLDETATTTVQKPSKILAPRGIRCISKVTSGERGTLSTTCAIICASGVSLPPVIIFPRRNFKNHMLHGCKIKALRAKTNTYIKTPVRGEEPVFVVTGRKEDVAKAKREILSAAEHFSLIRASRKPVLAGNLGKVPPGPPSIPGQVTIQVRVPYRVVGLVVGPKGATIKHIQQETHTYIVTPSREKEPIFEVTGLPDNVQAARKQIEAHIALRTGNLSPSVQTINSLSQMFIGDELSPEFLASIYKNGICSTFDYVDAQVSPDDGSGCNMVVPNQVLHASASNIGAFNGNSNHHLQQAQQHQLHQAVNGVVSTSNLVMNGLSGAMMGGNTANSSIVNNSVNGNGLVGGVNGTSTGGSRSCSSSSSSTSSKSATNSRPELMNIWKNLGESLDVDEGLGESPNIWTLPSVTGPIGCSPSQSVSPTDSLLGGAGGSTGSNNISHMISSTSAANIVNNGNRAGIVSTASQQLNNIRRECLVCGDKEVTAALVPCGHNMFCMECANHICTSVDGCCPVCSQTVYHAMRILP